MAYSVIYMHVLKIGRIFGATLKAPPHYYLHPVNLVSAVVVV